MAPGTDPPSFDLRHCGLGGPMGTEAPAAYLGVATGAALGDRWRRWLIRPLAVGGGAAGVAVLMGIPLVGTAYILDLGRRHQRSAQCRAGDGRTGGRARRMASATFTLGVDLIRLVIPKEPPHSLYQGLITALLIGVLSGSITSISGAAIYRAKGLASPAHRPARARRASSWQVPQSFSR